MKGEPLIPATVIGSWSFPGWYEKFVADVDADPGRFGQADREEAVRDAVRLAVDDQLRAGLDRITDGEMQRVDFNLGFYEYLHGLEPFPGRDGGARRPTISATGIDASRPFRARRARDRRRISTAPRGHRRAGQDAGPRAVHAGRLHRRRRRLRRSRRGHRGAGPDRQRRAEGPGRRRGRLHPARRAQLRLPPGDRRGVPRRHRATVAGVDAYISMHMCFGNYRARAVGRRSYRPLFPQVGRAPVNQLALEFASREMAEVELLAELPETMDVAVGLVDVKNTWIEPPELVAERLRTVLKFVDAGAGLGDARLRVLADRPARRDRQGEGDGRGGQARAGRAEADDRAGAIGSRADRGDPGRPRRPRVRSTSGGWDRAAS